MASQRSGRGKTTYTTAISPHHGGSVNGGSDGRVHINQHAFAGAHSPAIRRSVPFLDGQYYDPVTGQVYALDFAQHANLGYYQHQEPEPVLNAQPTGLYDVNEQSTTTSPSPSAFGEDDEFAECMRFVDALPAGSGWGFDTPEGIKNAQLLESIIGKTSTTTTHHANSQPLPHHPKQTSKPAFTLSEATKLSKCGLAVKVHPTSAGTTLSLGQKAMLMLLDHQYEELEHVSVLHGLMICGFEREEVEVIERQITGYMGDWRARPCGEHVVAVLRMYGWLQ